VFMSINPLAEGHALVVPVAEVDHWVDLPDELAAHLFAVAHRVGRAQQAAFGCDRVGLIIAGYEVPHTHLHVIPTEHMGQLNFANAATSVDRDRLEASAQAIRDQLSG
jgi:histidine triad (HIT) family protein